MARDLDFTMEQSLKRLRRNQRAGFQTGDASGSLTDRVIDEFGAYPTNEFVEWLMGFPLGWTALEPSETLSFPKSLNGSDVA
jgi:hypothetical protein